MSKNTTIGMIAGLGIGIDIAHTLMAMKKKTKLKFCKKDGTNANIIETKVNKDLPIRNHFYKKEAE